MADDQKKDEQNKDEQNKDEQKKDEQKKDDLDDDDDVDESNDTVSREELKKVIKTRDKVKQRLRATEAELEEIRKKLSETEGLKEKVTKLTEAEQELTRLKKEKDEAELASKTEAEKEAIRYKKELEKFKEDMNAKFNDKFQEITKKDEKIGNLEKEVSTLRTVRLEREIVSAASKYNAVNPNQIVRLLKGDFEYDSTDGAYYHNVIGKRGGLEDQVDVDAYVKKFLEDEDNSNLVKGGAKAGTGTSTRTDSSSSRKSNIESKSEGLSDAQVTEKLKAWAKTHDYNWDDSKDKSFISDLYDKHGDKMFK